LGVDFEWLKKKIGPLLEVELRIKQIDPNVYYETGSWCVTKLIALAYFIDIYTKIIPKMPFFKKMRYIELLSGAGLCKIRETGDLIAGSALISATMCNRQFDEYVLVESDKLRAEALEKRMKIVTPYICVINNDCNKAINDIISKIDENDHYLAFIDSEGLEVDWQTIESLLSKQGDLIFNLNIRNKSKKMNPMANTPTTKYMNVSLPHFS